MKTVGVATALLGVVVLGATLVACAKPTGLDQFYKEITSGKGPDIDLDTQRLLDLMGSILPGLAQEKGGLGKGDLTSVFMDSFSSFAPKFGLNEDVVIDTTTVIQYIIKMATSEESVKVQAAFKQLSPDDPEQKKLRGLLRRTFCTALEKSGGWDHLYDRVSSDKELQKFITYLERFCGSGQ